MRFIDAASLLLNASENVSALYMHYTLGIFDRIMLYRYYFYIFNIITRNSTDKFLLIIFAAYAASPSFYGYLISHTPAMIFPAHAVPSRQMGHAIPI